VPKATLFISGAIIEANHPIELYTFNCLFDSSLHVTVRHRLQHRLEFGEVFLDHTGALDDLDYVEADGLAEGSALPHRHHVTNVDVPEAGAEVHGKVLVALLEALVLAHVVQVVAADDDRALHLHLEHDARQDATTDGHVAGEWTFLVDVRPLDSFSGSLEAKANALDMTGHLHSLADNYVLLFVEEDSGLLLKRSLGLLRHRGPIL